jgi:N-carbamoyl-L-amino-acid hydrolase
LEEVAARSGLRIERDRAANLWIELPGDTDDLVVLGSHLDSVPNGGWLDGALGVWAGLAVLTELSERQTPLPCSVALVDWADEEGARFGHSLFGSSAFVGSLEPGGISNLTDNEGTRASDVLDGWGVQLDSLIGPDPRLERIAAYLELHIEQGPILEEAGLSVATVDGTVGIERDRFHFTGQGAHAGPTPMNTRKDAFLAAAETALALENLAISENGKATTGRVDLEPGVPTVVPGTATLYVDLRHAEAATLERMRTAAAEIATTHAEKRNVDVNRERIWSISPRAFDASLIALAQQACEAAGASSFTMSSGALHDAAELADQVPTVMMFCASKAGLSHCPQEDSSEEDLGLAIRAFSLLVSAVIEGNGWLGQRRNGNVDQARPTPT